MIFPAKTWLCHHTSLLLCLIAFILIPDSLSGQYVSFFDLSANAKREKIVIHNNQAIETHTFHSDLQFDSLGSLDFFEALSNQEKIESPMIEPIALGISSDWEQSTNSHTSRIHENILHSQIKVDSDQTSGKNQIANDLRVGMQSLSLFSFDFPEPQNLEIKTVHYQEFTNGPSSHPQIDFYEKVDYLAESAYDLDLHNLHENQFYRQQKAFAISPSTEFPTTTSMHSFVQEVPLENIAHITYNHANFEENVFAWSDEEFDSYRERVAMDDFNLPFMHFNLNTNDHSLLELNFSSPQSMPELERNYSDPNSIWFSSYNSTTKFEFSNVNLARTLSFKNKPKLSQGFPN